MYLSYLAKIRVNKIVFELFTILLPRGALFITEDYEHRIVVTLNNE